MRSLPKVKSETIATLERAVKAHKEMYSQKVGQLLEKIQGSQQQIEKLEKL